MGDGLYYCKDGTSDPPLPAKAAMDSASVARPIANCSRAIETGVLMKNRGMRASSVAVAGVRPMVHQRLSPKATLNSHVTPHHTSFRG